MMVGEPNVRSTGESSIAAVNRSGWLATNSTSSYRVTNHRPTAGMKHTGASRRSRA